MIWAAGPSPSSSEAFCDALDCSCVTFVCVSVCDLLLFVRPKLRTMCLCCALFINCVMHFYYCPIHLYCNH